MFDFSIVTNWFDTLLRQTCGLSDFWAILIECVLVGVIVLTAYALICIVLIFMERKVCAYFQCRVGPMRVGPWGIFQVFADAYERQSVVITTNLEFSRWGSVFGDDQMAAAVIGRIVHHGRLVQFRGESYRVRHALMQEG